VGNSNNKATLSLTLATLGVVFGDIGTSPLYAVRETFHGAHAIAATPENVFGILSLILWSLIIVVSIKYLFFVLRADNRGEGGALALTALAAPPHLTRRSRLNKAALYLGLFGAALLFGDGVITPAISVLSAVEGLKVATPLFTPYVIPITMIILVMLFMAQRQGTARIGKVYGPIILTWFITIGALGLNGIIDNPEVLFAFNPLYAIEFFQINGWTGFIVLSSVFLVVTGGESLYADMGHFGRKPIQKAWFVAAFPALLLNYLGQGALLLMTPEAADNPFFRLAPTWALYPVVGLATVSAVIASQALISGVFSLTRQAVQLGFSPRFRTVHTSSQEIGQIYIPNVNWALLVLTCWVVFEFRTSSELASAYGIAVATTMIVTTTLACLVAYQRWRWSPFAVLGVLIFFLTTDFVFFAANITKIADGGWVPLLIGMSVFTGLTTWRRGRQILAERLRQKTIPLADFIKKAEARNYARVPGIAVFMTSDPEGTPPALLHNSRHNKALHTNNVLLTIGTEDVPHISKQDRIEITPLPEGFYRVTAYYGFMETPNVPDILDACSLKGVELPISKVSFFLGRETLIPSARPGMAIWREVLFSFMSKNAERATNYFSIPADQVVELGIQIEI
jgi:KUP system potassium uptake protein